ncbi:chromate efflux transporter [Poseidonibacter lekithochrous]|uniref:chromate efflux transporter n=1 Tax=Poseidonibacter lekithochrous TaxID=1904463 RepID=UPI0008FCD7E6|nr:chromate efflux transporter [Poseidonibacter lekithochrous]QKJ21365.1 chromate transporter [Poseidonibacter lekithochrous]
MKNIFDIFIKFFSLGLISFGGPMAHIAYFQKRFVEQLKWLDEQSYSKLLALSQFLPGPNSSQVGFAIGLKRGGLIGAITAFIAFTFPSFIILYILATFSLGEAQNSFIAGIILGLKLFAVVIVSDASITMFKSFCKDKITIGIFTLATILLIFISSTFIQIAVLILSAILGRVFIKTKQDEEIKESKKTKKLPLLIFFVLLLTLPFLANESLELKLISSFYEVGSLVFGGGHVVLPLLEENLNTLVSKDNFLLAYSLAQAVPGPMFTIASYLGADIMNESALYGALIATVSIFLPGLLLILAFSESFESYSKKKTVLSALAGINAAVVGLLVSVLIVSVGPNAVHSLFDLIIVISGLILIRSIKLPILIIILIFIVIGLIKSFF